MKLLPFALLERSCLETLIDHRAPEHKSKVMNIYRKHGLHAALRYIAKIETDARDRINSLLHHAKKII